MQTSFVAEGGRKEGTVLIQVACYNAQHTLADMLNSVLAQSHQDFLVVICDDASEDNSLDIARDFESKDERIHVLANKTNIGVNRTRNNILNYAHGLSWQFCAVIDSDDVAEPYWLEHCLEALLKGALAVRCIGMRCSYDLKNELYSHLTCAQFFVERNTIKALGYYREKPYTADDDYMERLEKYAVLKGRYIVSTRVPVQKMRIGDGNLSNTKGSVQRVRMERRSRMIALKTCCSANLFVPIDA